MSIIPQSSGKSFFPHFCENVPHFSFILGKSKFPKNCDNFQRPEDILWTEALRKRPKRAPAMFLTWKSDCESSTYGQKTSIFVCVCTSIDVRKDENIIERRTFLAAHVDTYGIDFCKWYCIFVIYFNVCCCWK